jgi:hypothetical protein
MPEVVLHGAGEGHGPLAQQDDLGAIKRRRPVCGGKALKKDASTGQGIEQGQLTQEQSLAGSRGPPEPEAIARLQIEVEVVPERGATTGMGG